jgi:voltage-gated potassium channel
MSKRAPDSVESISAFQVLLVVLSLLVIAALLVDAVVPIPKEVSTIVQALDLAACALFFIDFCIRFFRSSNKLHFMRWGWIDLLACVPNVDLLRVGRMVRVLRLIRLLRGVRVGHRLLSIFLQNKPKSAFSSVLLTTLLLITFSSISILVVETDQDANIKTAEDAIWWSVTTITTVGYGDKYPVSTEGRLIAMVLMISGVGLFGTLSGIVASVFLGAQSAETENEMAEVLARLRSIESKLNDRPHTIDGAEAHERDAAPATAEIKN